MERELFKVNGNLFYAEDPHVKKNVFLTREADPADRHLPTYDEIKDKLPKPIFEGHDDVIACYDKTWSIAFGNLRKANYEAGFVSDFIDTAFNGFLFMWDSSFIVMFGKYASRLFDFQRTLDNFYSHQHRDGFICREICETRPGEQFSRDDPSSTGPNVLPWAEWVYYLSTGNKERIANVFDPLLAYHKWLQLNRSWPDGSYWSNGLACGMDNQPRAEREKHYNSNLSHGFMSWIDTCSQQYLSGNILIKMAKILGREDEVDWLVEETEMLANTINNTMWDEKEGFYFDKYRTGKTSGIKTVGAYWALLADLVPKERMDRFVAHLDNENEFKRPNRVPTLAYNDPMYRPDGDYWMGSVWAPTNYMVLTGLHEHGYHKLAYDIACDYLKNVVEVFDSTGTVFENYAPETAAPGSTSRRDFVGWTGLAPISVLFESVFGIHPDAQNRRATWYINRTERHGIKQYPLGDATVDLICEARKNETERPVVSVKSDKPVEIEIHWNNETWTIKA